MATVNVTVQQSGSTSVVTVPVPTTPGTSPVPNVTSPSPGTPPVAPAGVAVPGGLSHQVMLGVQAAYQSALVQSAITIAVKAGLGTSPAPQPGTNPAPQSGPGVGGAIATGVLATAARNTNIASTAARGAAAFQVGGPLALAAFAVAESFFQLKGAANRLLGEFDALARSYGGIAPKTATAMAESGVREFQADFRRAQQIDPDLARFVELQTDISLILGDVRAMIQRGLIQGVIPIMELIAQTLNLMNEGSKAAASFVLDEINAMPAFVRGFLDPFGVVIPILKRILDAIIALRPDDESNFEAFMNGLLNPVMGSGAVPPIPPVGPLAPLGP